MKKDSIFYVYVILNPLRPGYFTYENFCSFMYEPIYIGKGNGSRIDDHWKIKNNHYNPILKGVFKKLTNLNTVPIISKLAFNMIESEAFNFEKFLIKIIGRVQLKNGPLANLTDGGDGCSGLVISQEHRHKISIALKGVPKSKEHNKKVGDAHRGRKMTEAQNLANSERNKNMINIKHIELSQNKRIKLNELDSYSKLGWVKGTLPYKMPPRSNEYCKSISERMMGHKTSEETKNKISTATKGRQAWNKGISPSEETRHKMRIAKLGKPGNRLGKKLKEAIVAPILYDI